MPDRDRIVAPGPSPRSVVADDGRVLVAPDGWALLPPGDAGLTRRVKAAGPAWTVREARGRKTFSRGVWAASAIIEAARAALAAERATPAHARRLVAGSARRAREQAGYVGSFEKAVLDFLAFHPGHRGLAEALAAAVARHATPVGSGTVARTRRIPIERRAEAAVIAWMRHRTTAYDRMAIPRVQGRRHEVRRLLAAHSRAVLDVYRWAAGGGPDCPLRRALTPTSSGEISRDSVVGQFELLNKRFSADRSSIRCDNGCMSNPRQPKRPADLNQRAYQVFLEAIGESLLGDPTHAPQDETPSESLRQAAAELGRRGGLKGGKARAAGMTPERRAEIAKKAAAARWGKDSD